MTMTMIMTKIMIKYTMILTMATVEKAASESMSRRVWLCQVTLCSDDRCTPLCAYLYIYVFACVYMLLCCYMCSECGNRCVYLCSQKHFETRIQCDITLHTDNVRNFDVNQHSNTSYMYWSIQVILIHREGGVEGLFMRVYLVVWFSNWILVPDKAFNPLIQLTPPSPLTPLS